MSHSDVHAFRFRSLAAAGLRHAILERHGGVSDAPWDTLNLGGTVGDEPEHVEENTRRAVAHIGKSADSIFDVWQVHSARIVRAHESARAHSRADGIVTDRREVTLVMRFADCVPIIAYDPRRHVAGIAHAGWK